MAIRVLLDHGVPQDHIVFVTLLAARHGGVAVLAGAFPQVKIVCGAIDDKLVEQWLPKHVESDDIALGGETQKAWVIEPGMGQMGEQSHFYYRSILN
jgi:uridine kinase